MTSQLQIPIIYDARFVDEQHREAAMTELREVIGSPECPYKDVVYDCEIPKSSLSMALSLKETHAHDVPLRVFLYAARRARTDSLAAIVANIRNRDLCPRELTAEQRLAKLEAAVSRLGPAAEAVFADAGLR